MIPELMHVRSFMVVRGRWLSGVLLAAIGAGGVWGGALWAAGELGLPNSASKGVVLEPLAGLPEGKMQAGVGEKGVGIHAGTAGLALPGVRRDEGNRGVTIAVLGDLAPAEKGERDKYLKMAVSQLNLLRPELVLTVGNLVPGMTREGSRYVREVAEVRGMLDGLKMPWYPCVGETDVVSGVRPGDLLATGGNVGRGDRRFEEAYQRLMGPLYYSVDAGGEGGVHAIVLDSEEGVGDTISDAQFRWLQGDLNRTFDAGMGGNGPRWVVVVVHRPLWRAEGKATGTSWKRVHEALVAFNQRPVASVEGMGGGGTAGGMVARGPRVAGVFAGDERAYAMEPVRDGIRYYVMGPTAAVPRAGEEVSETLRAMMLVKFDGSSSGGGGMNPAVIQLGMPVGDAGAVVAEDVVTARERATVDAIAGWGEEVMGVEGMIDDRGNAMGKPLSLHLSNPLADAVEVELRLASSMEGLGAGWELRTAQPLRHMAPGSKTALEFSLMRLGDAVGPPPVVELVVHWTDARGRLHEVVLPRRLTRVPAVEVVASPKALGLESVLGEGATGVACAWPPLRNDAPAKADPTIQMAADGEHLLVRVRVEDTVKSYWPVMRLDRAWGGIASDAVSVAWAKGAGDKQVVERVWVVPFGPKGAELWTNTGVGERQTELLRVDPKAGIQAAVKADASGYTVTVMLPRKVVCEEVAATLPATAATAPATQARVVMATAVLNVVVQDNDETLRTWSKSWCREEAWGRVEVVQQVGAATRVP